MTRVALTVLLPLLAPTALYFLWYYAFGRKEETGSARRPVCKHLSCSTCRE